MACDGSAMGRCVSLTGSCLGRNLPRYFNLERREICAGGLFLSLPPTLDVKLAEQFFPTFFCLFVSLNKQRGYIFKFF